MIEALIFDLFGTLVHIPRRTNPYLQLCRAIGDSERVRESLVIDAPSLADFCDHIGAAHPLNLGDIQRDLNDEIDNASLFEDALPTIKVLIDRGIRIAIVSNLASPYKKVVSQLGLGTYFDAALYSCDLGIAKPNPEIYLAALDQLGSSATRTLMVGDSQRADVDGPMSCGIRGLLIDRRVHSSSASVLRTLTDVTAHLGS